MPKGLMLRMGTPGGVWSLWGLWDRGRAPPISQQHLQMQPAPGQSRPITINLLTAQGQGWLVPGGERATGWGGPQEGGPRAPSSCARSWGAFRPGGGRAVGKWRHWWLPSLTGTRGGTRCVCTWPRTRDTQLRGAVMLQRGARSPKEPEVPKGPRWCSATCSVLGAGGMWGIASPGLPA